MAFKIKQEKTAPELENARTKLEEALQYIIDKTDESPSTSEDESNKLAEIQIKKEPSPVSSPTKRQTQRTQRKRRRKDEGLNRNTNSYVMKLFDRAVDLTPFNEQTPLYPICRAWIKNQALFLGGSPIKEEPTNGENDLNEDGDKESDENNSDEVRQLPLPKPFPSDGRDLRIPSPVPKPDKPFNVCSDDQNSFTKELLMTNHLQHWKAVRQKWKQAAKRNEDRYRESGAILKAMFERSQCDDDPPVEPWNPLATTLA